MASPAEKRSLPSGSGDCGRVPSFGRNSPLDRPHRRRKTMHPLAERRTKSGATENLILITDNSGDSKPRTPRIRDPD